VDLLGLKFFFLSSEVSFIRRVLLERFHCMFTSEVERGIIYILMTTSSRSLALSLLKVPFHCLS